MGSVFILGAGASKQAGAPLMAEFLDIAHDLWKSQAVDDVGDDFERVFKARGALQIVHSKARLDINNLESVFAAFEMGKLLDKFPGHTLDEIDKINKSIKILIYKTLEMTLRFGQGQVPSPPAPYDAFVNLLLGLRDKKPPSPISVLTFNYDLGLDYACHYASLPVRYFVDNEDSNDGISLLKLHGSLNWGYCSNCNTIVPWRLGIYLNASREPLTLRKVAGLGKYFTLPLQPMLKKLSHGRCSQPFDPEPLIVPPTWNKGEHHRSIARVWSKAALELERAENIIVIGYSLPESDSFFRYLFSLGSISGDTLLRRFWVFNPEARMGPVEQRFRNLLGHGAQERFEYFPEPFSAAIKTLGARLQVK